MELRCTRRAHETSKAKLLFLTWAMWCSRDPFLTYQQLPLLNDVERSILVVPDACLCKNSPAKVATAKANEKETFCWSYSRISRGCLAKPDVKLYSGGYPLIPPQKSEIHYTKLNLMLALEEGREKVPCTDCNNYLESWISIHFSMKRRHLKIRWSKISMWYAWVHCSALWIGQGIQGAAFHVKGASLGIVGVFHMNVTTGRTTNHCKKRSWEMIFNVWLIGFLLTCLVSSLWGDKFEGDTHTCHPNRVP